MTRRQLQALVYLEAGTAVRTEAFDGVVSRLEREAIRLSPQEQEQVGHLVDAVANMLTSRGQRLQQ